MFGLVVKRNVAAGDWVSKSVRGKGGLCLLFFIFSRFSLVCGESFRHSVYGDFIHKSTSSCLLRLLHIDLFPDPKLVRRFHLKKVCVHLSCMRRTNLLWVWLVFAQMIWLPFEDFVGVRVNLIDLGFSKSRFVFLACVKQIWLLCSEIGLMLDFIQDRILLNAYCIRVY